MIFSSLGIAWCTSTNLQLSINLISFSIYSTRVDAWDRLVFLCNWMDSVGEGFLSRTNCSCAQQLVEDYCKMVELSAKWTWNFKIIDHGKKQPWPKLSPLSIPGPEGWGFNNWPFEFQYWPSQNSGGGGHLGIFWVGMCRPGLQIGTPF